MGQTSTAMAPSNKASADFISFIVAGPPAGGKGTMCKNLLKEWEGVVHLSTGDMLRTAVKEGTEAGKIAGPLMEQGALVPDEIVVGCVRDALNTRKGAKTKGFMLDGFPRSLGQAAELDKMLAGENITLSHVVALDVADKDLK